MKLFPPAATVLLFTIFANTAIADAGHGGTFTFGSPGEKREVTRTIEVEASDAMRFIPSGLEVKQGETIRFVVKNRGRIKHEFSIGDRAAQRAHAAMMKQMPEMRHADDATTITVEPGQIKTLIWKFDKKPASPIEIACHEPGHYEGGMKADVVLTR